MRGRLQRTIRRPVETTGIGFLSGRDITIRFVPSEPDQGVVFHRTDVAGGVRIPARIEFTVPRQRRTAIERDGFAVEMIEHVMAALAGLQVDNCLVELDGSEPPGFDGSSQQLAELIQSAGFEEQAVARRVLIVPSAVAVEHAGGEIAYSPGDRSSFTIRYGLDYGDRSPIPVQDFSLDVTPASFLRELAFARTFLLEHEVDGLRALGYGSRTTTEDLLVFGPKGPIGNALRAADECARHKVLDCVGDFALLGCDVYGTFHAHRSGHELNRQMVRALFEHAASQSIEGHRSIPSHRGRRAA